MDLLFAGIASTYNGVRIGLGSVLDPVVAAFTLTGLCLCWLALIEIHELDRMGAKPDVLRH